MQNHTFDNWTRRRLTQAAGGLATSLLGLSQVEEAGAQPKGNGKKRRPVLCRPNGTKCRTKGVECQKQFCLTAPLFFESSWRGDFYTDSFLFVPKKNARTGPSPYVDGSCNESTSQCESQYPFACMTEDQTSPGYGRTILYQLLPGSYEYWVRLNAVADAGEVVVTLRNVDETLLKTWSSPANPGGQSRGWHVFDLDGKTGSIKTVDDLTAGGEVPRVAHRPSTLVCPV